MKERSLKDELMRLYGENPLTPDVYGNRKATANEVYRAIYVGNGKENWSKTSSKQMEKTFFGNPMEKNLGEAQLAEDTYVKRTKHKRRGR